MEGWKEKPGRKGYRGRKGKLGRKGKAGDKRDEERVHLWGENFDEILNAGAPARTPWPISAKFGVQDYIPLSYSSSPNFTLIVTYCRPCGAKHRHITALFDQMLKLLAHEPIPLPIRARFVVRMCT